MTAPAFYTNPLALVLMVRVESDRMDDPRLVLPPNDSGSDTFARYCYQAYVALPYCLACALRAGVRSVVLEHFEDFALEYDDRWRLVQVKTRDPELGPWRLADLLDEGGALRSLLRSYRILGDGNLYEAHLEGAVKQGDPITKFRKPGEGLGEDPEILARIGKALELSPDECARFTAQIRIRADQPLRSVIVARNIRLLGGHAPSLSMVEVEETHKNLALAIFDAMAAQRFGAHWPKIIVDDSSDTSIKEALDKKRLTPESLSHLTAKLTPHPKPLLRRLTDNNSTSPTLLEVKLLAGGATESIINDAKSLRANATIRRTEYLAGSLYSEDEKLEDIRERLRIRVNGLVALHSPGSKPAVEIWNRLLEILTSNPRAFDGFGIFSDDPYLLLGEVCELADECTAEWGVTDA